MIESHCDELEEGNLFEFYLKVAPKLSDLAKNKHFALDQLTRSEDNLILVHYVKLLLICLHIQTI